MPLGRCNCSSWCSLGSISIIKITSGFSIIFSSKLLTNSSISILKHGTTTKSKSAMVLITHRLICLVLTCWYMECEATSFQLLLMSHCLMRTLRFSEGLWDENMLQSRQTNNWADEAPGSWLAQNPPPQNLNKVNVEPPAGIFTDEEILAIDHSLFHLLGAVGDDEVAELRTEALVLACSFHPELFLKVFVPLTRQQHSRPSLTVAIIKPYCNPIIYSTSNLFWTLNFEIISNVSRTLPLPKTKPSRLVYYQFQLALDPPPSVASEDKDSDPSISWNSSNDYRPIKVSGLAKDIQWNLVVNSSDLSVGLWE